jgi:pentatricopeptide repeat protein
MSGHGCTPNSRSYNSLLRGFCREKNIDRAIEYLEIMESRGCSRKIYGPIISF